MECMPAVCDGLNVISEAIFYQDLEEAYALTTGEHSIFTYYLLESCYNNGYHDHEWGTVDMNTCFYILIGLIT
jgi:hypothetical protein